MITLLFVSGVQLFSLGLVGEYIGRIFEEVKARPAYVVDRTVNLEVFGPSPAGAPWVDDALSPFALSPVESSQPGLPIEKGRPSPPHDH
jgi:hypothetical protein